MDALFSSTSIHTTVAPQAAAAASTLYTRGGLAASIDPAAAPPTIAHLIASPFFGGPERQILGLSLELRPHCQSIFFSFANHGCARPFEDELRRHGFEVLTLSEDTPAFLACVREIADLLQQYCPRALLCHGYKPDLLGLAAGKWAGVPVLSISRGWTGATAKVRGYDTLDKRLLRYMDRVVCVSEGQADKVRRHKVAQHKLCVIHNSIRAQRFSDPDPSAADELRALFAQPPAQVVLAGGRLSPEKGFADLIDAAVRVIEMYPATGFLIFGEGPLRQPLRDRILRRGLEAKFILAGFTPRLDRYLPFADIVVLSSLTEGLPNIALEALAAGVPVVATRVGGNPEVVRDGQSGRLVPASEPDQLAEAIGQLLADPAQRRALGNWGRQDVRQRFTFEAQAQSYLQLLRQLCPGVFHITTERRS